MSIWVNSIHSFSGDKKCFGNSVAGKESTCMVGLGTFETVVKCVGFIEFDASGFVGAIM